jgi:hypothetical protein
MSSQTLNATTYSGYQASAALNYVPTRDSSDVTRMIRERIRYNEFKSGSTIAPGNTENPWVPYGNNFRLSYLQGKLKCATCAGNAFYGNGPYVNNVGANTGSSSNGPS